MHVRCIAAPSTARYPQAISAHGDRGFAAAGEKRGRAVETTQPPRLPPAWCLLHPQPRASSLARQDLRHRWRLGGGGHG
jgi:hypothetical protein